MAIRITQFAVEVLSTVESSPAVSAVQAALEVATVVEVQTVTNAVVDQAALEVAIKVGVTPPPPQPPAGAEPVMAQGTNVQMSIDECADVNADPLPVMVVLDCTTKSVSVTGGTSAAVAVSTMCSSAAEFRIGKTDPGTLQVEGFWKIGNAAHDAVCVAGRDRKRRLLVVTFRDGSVWRCVAMVSQRSWNAGVDSVVGSTFTFKLTGPAVEVRPPVVN